jgi:hypothetical protein
MTNVLRQLKQWRFTEQVIRLVWGASRCAAILGIVLAFACATDWLADRYLGSESWRNFRKATWIFAPSAAPSAEERWFSDHHRLTSGLRLPPATVIDDTPKWLRVAMTTSQIALAIGLVYFLILRPLRRTPPIDDLAVTAEKAIPEFDHRLVTAVQLNRPTAKTQGMSKVLIEELTREASDIASKHNLRSLVDYKRVLFAVIVAVPVLLGWAAYALSKSQLTTVLLKRQMLLNVEIPRTIQLENQSQDVWPTGAEVTVRYKVTGEYNPAMTGRLRVEPDGQPEESYDLVYEKDAPDGGAFFITKLPPSTLDFSFTARLDNGRTREAGRIKFEAPPQLSNESDAITAEQLLPDFLGRKPDMTPYTRNNDGWTRGEVNDALPLSRVYVEAKFNKPIVKARLIPIVRDGIQEKDFPGTPADFHLPIKFESGDKSARWLFPTNAKMIAYRIELTDQRGFVNSVPIRRNVRMLEDRPPVVAFMPETTRHPDVNDFEGQGDARVYEWGDKMPLAEGGRIMVIYNAKSEQGISRVNIRYRVIAKGIPLDKYPPEYREIQHPSEDPENKVYARLPLKPVSAKLDVVGKFIPDLGLFEKSWDGLSGVRRADRMKVSIEYYPVPAPNAEQPGELEAGGRYMFEVDGLMKMVPSEDGKTLTPAKLELGDTVQLYVEAFDKNPTPGRPAGYTKEARRKIVVPSEEAAIAIKMRDEQNKRLQDKLKDLAADQANVFKDQQPKKDPMEPKKVPMEPMDPKKP